MRGNLRKWCVLGALASAAWVFPGCKSDSRDLSPQQGLDRSSETPSQQGTGGSGPMDKSIPTVKRGTSAGTMAMDGGMSTDAGMIRDSGMGGAGFDPAAVPNTVPQNMR